MCFAAAYKSGTRPQYYSRSIMKTVEWIIKFVGCLMCWFRVNTALADPLPDRFYYTDYSPIQWGEEKQGIKVGVRMLVLTNLPFASQNGVWFLPWWLFQTNSLTKFYVGNTNSNTNCFVGRLEGAERVWSNSLHYSRRVFWTQAHVCRLGPVEKNFQIDLTDASGVEVPRTAAGEKIRSTFIDYPKYESDVNDFHGVTRHGLTSGEQEVISSGVRMDNFFKLTNAGTYHMQLQMRVFCTYGAHTPYETNVPLFLPPVDVDFCVPEQPKKEASLGK